VIHFETLHPVLNRFLRHNTRVSLNAAKTMPER